MELSNMQARLYPSLAIVATLCVAAQAADPAAVRYRLPVEGPLPRTYLVTLAITESTNADWVVSTFVAGQPRTVTAENDGWFTETWNGLDENFMPVPPGEYGVKGICSPASQWPVDGEWHAITARYMIGFSPWFPPSDTPELWKIPIPFNGDPVNSPFRDVDVGPNGVAVFYYQYLENGKNCPMFDLNRPVGHQQFIRAFASGGAGGGSDVATDGQSVWAASGDGGGTFVYRADQKPFGTGAATFRRNVYLPEGRLMGLAAWRNEETGKSYLYVSQRGKIVKEAPSKAFKYGRRYESTTEFVNQIVVLDGADGKVLGAVDMVHPGSVVARGGFLHVLHLVGVEWVVSRIPLGEGVPEGRWQKVVALPSQITPADLEVDGSGRLYVSDRATNKVYQLGAGAQILRAFGRLDRQIPGAYDVETLMSPAKLATWTDGEGKDRLILCEEEGPNRVSEWDGDTGKLLREFPSYQTKCNSGYVVDPANPSHLYMPGQGDWLTRFTLDHTTHQWTVDAVWPGVKSGQRKYLEKPAAIRANGTLYLASERNLSVYRMSKAGDAWFLSAGLVEKDKQAFFWNDANGNGECDDEELRPTTLPGHVLTYHGQKWLPDFSYLAMGQGSRDVWRLAPSSFDAHGNPVFTAWQKVLADPIFAARAAGKADAIHGGNELAETFSSDWMQADGSMQDGFYIHARGGKSFTANFGAQYKISRYVPDGKGGYAIKWRVGRAKLGQAGVRGELEGGMRLFKPMNGLLAVIDQSRSGVFLYTDDGLYVDTLFPPGWTREEIGIYRQPGEFFAGTVYPNADNGKIYASGKYTPVLYEMENWSLTENPVTPLAVETRTVSLAASQIGDPPEMAISLRGGSGKTSVARFLPALGGVSLDGSMAGWEAAQTVVYSGSAAQTVEARCLYNPDHLYVRWHVQLGSAFVAKPLPPLERIFTHDQESDTVGLYFQGDVNASASTSANGRPGDVRIVFGLFGQGEALVPVAVGMYPEWKASGAQPQIYRSPVGQVAFEHVAAVAGAKLGAVVDADQKGFVIAAAIPRSAIPAMARPFSGDTRTLVNFDANLGGHGKFWWANTDGTANSETYDEPSEARLYPGSWAPAQFEGLGGGVPVRQWRIAGPFGGPGAERFSWDPRNKDEVKRFYEAATYPPDDGTVDLEAVFTGELIRGYWSDPRQVRWTPATIADMDTRVVLGSGSQVWYGSSWIHSPEEMTLDCDFQGHKMTPIRWRINGEAVNIPEKAYTDDDRGSHMLSAQRPITLRKGWNQVFFRGYNVGYAPFRIGIVLKGDAVQLWKLTFSANPEAKE
jgi:hypothetical protein